MPYVHRHYTHFQLIAYEIPTLNPQGPGNESPQVDGPLALPRSLSDPKFLDEKRRLKRLAGVVNMARKRVESTGGDNSSTLKIFMAPEFYFRPLTGPSHSYSRESMFNIMEALRGLFVNKVFQDWLFVPGTIFWNQPADPRSPQDPRRRTSIDFFNTATLIKGGAEAKEDTWFHFVHKRQISNIDGAPMENAAVLNLDLAPILSDWDERKQNYLPLLDSRRFGIEVCLDHHQVLRTLKSVYLEMRKRDPHPFQSGVDCHLLTACGMAVQSRSTAARRGGYILRVDGHPTIKPHSEIMRVEKQDSSGEMWLPGIVSLPGNATLSQHDEKGTLLNRPFWQVQLPANLTLAVSQDDNKNLPQRLVCYQRQPFPKFRLEEHVVMF